MTLQPAMLLLSHICAVAAILAVMAWLLGVPGHVATPVALVARTLDHVMFYKPPKGTP